MTTTATWSPNLKNIITILADLQPYKRRTLLSDPKFTLFSKLTGEEKELVNNVYLKSKKIKEETSSFPWG
jgi:hypothetical protein